MRSSNFIGGEWVPGDGPTTRRIANPADTTQLIAAVREASAAQADAACAAAHAAFPAWRATPALPGAGPCPFSLPGAARSALR